MCLVKQQNKKDHNKDSHKLKGARIKDTYIIQGRKCCIPLSHNEIRTC